jgi:hypothetical protein
MRNKIQTCLKIVKLLHKQTTPHTIKQFAHEPVLRKLFDRGWGPLDNVLFEPITLALRKKRDYPGFYACDGSREAAMCIASFRKVSTTWWSVSERRLPNQSEENEGDE